MNAQARDILNLPQVLQAAGGKPMVVQDVTNILGIVMNLVSRDRTIDQESTAVRDFKAATTELIARLEAARSDTDPDTAPKQ